jgi:hypothetical protein
MEMFSWFMPRNGKLRELASLPEGIAVTHSPNPVRAFLEEETGKKPTYRWIYRTTVWTTGSAIEIVEFGSFSWHKGKWAFSNFTGKPFSNLEFSDWYGCPEGRLLPGESAVDANNWTGGQKKLSAGKMLWYYIGHDEAGRRVKGEATVHLLGEVE